jgi:hypothetical protein
MRYLRIHEFRKPRPLRRAVAREYFAGGLAVLALLLLVGEGLLPGQSHETPLATGVQARLDGKPQEPVSEQARASQPGAAPATSGPDRQAPAQQIAEQASSLLKMATDLKTEVYKTPKDTLSVAVIRKAGEIEQLARTLRSK